ncbi:MAG: hypothetical protein HFI29_10550 [Lachnospiraceae bacterium]|jgi:hypothetical protein|nr:hypothetical protein [Lachnospiraceae bacterium]
MRKIAKEKWPELLFVAFVLGLWLFWAFILPFNEGPDENMRSRIIEYIIGYGGLPTGYQQEIMDYSWGFTYGFRPILPQIVEAFFIRIGMFFTGDAFSLLFIGRLASVLCGLVFIGYVQAIGRKLFQAREIQWLFVLMVVCLPQAAFLFTYLNCDSMALMATAMITYYLLKGREDSFSTGTCIRLAVSLSICVLSYYNAYGFLITSVLVFGGSFLERSRKGEDCWKEFWKKGFLILGIVLVLAGWWFVRNYFLYEGDILGLRTQNEYAEQYAMDELKPSNRRTYRNRGLSMGDMLFRSDWAPSVLKSFIGVLGPLWYVLRWWMYLGYGLLFAAGGLGAFIGLVLRLLAWRKQKGRRTLDMAGLSLHLGFLVAVLVPNFLNFWYSYATDYQPQGRYSMPMLIPFMYYVVWGLAFWVKRLGRLGGALWRRLLLWAVRLVCLWIAGVFLFCVVRIMWPAYRDVEDKSVVKIYTMEELFGE